jgi:nucleoside-diphosphate-sugar epimerase
MTDGIISAMMTDNTKAEVINLGNPDERPINDIAKIIKTLTKSQSKLTNEPRPEDDPETRKPDITKAKTLLNWHPKITLEEGLKKTIEYFKNTQSS